MDTLKLTADLFNIEDKIFFVPNKCPIAIAFKNQFKESVWVSINDIRQLGGNTKLYFFSKSYQVHDFNLDKRLAIKEKFSSDSVIREIQLVKI